MLPLVMAARMGPWFWITRSRRLSGMGVAPPGSGLISSLGISSVPVMARGFSAEPLKRDLAFHRAADRREAGRIGCEQFANVGQIHLAEGDLAFARIVAARRQLPVAVNGGMRHVRIELDLDERRSLAPAAVCAVRCTSPSCFCSSARLSRHDVGIQLDDFELLAGFGVNQPDLGIRGGVRDAADRRLVLTDRFWIWLSATSLVLTFA